MNTAILNVFYLLLSNLKFLVESSTSISGQFDGSFHIHIDLYFPFIFESLLAREMGLHEIEIRQP